MLYIRDNGIRELSKFLVVHSKQPLEVVLFDAAKALNQSANEVFASRDGHHQNVSAVYLLPESGKVFTLNVRRYFLEI